MRDNADPRATDEARQRRVTFAEYIADVLDRAKEARGVTVAQVAKDADIGRATIYRWRGAEWERPPKPDQVLQFCRALRLDPGEAFHILGWTSERPATSPPQIPPTVEALLQKLADPSVPDSEKDDILRTVEWLANRPAPSKPVKRRRRAG